MLSYYIDFYFNNYIVKFCYFPHLPLTVSHSVLTCYISLQKSESKRLFHPLSQLCGYLGVCPENALTIPLILSKESMNDSFHYITDALKTITTEIENLSYDEEREAAFYKSEVESASLMFKLEYPTTDELNKFFDDVRKEWYVQHKLDQNDISDENEMKTKFNQSLSKLQNDVHSLIEEEKQFYLAYYYYTINMKAVSETYEAYMTGNYALSLKRFKKQKYTTQYERLLIYFMKNSQTPRPHVPDFIYKNLTELYKNGISKNNLKEALAIVPAMLLFSLMWLPLFLAIYFLFYFLENRDAVYLLGTLSNAPYALLPSLLCAIPMIYFNPKLFYKLFF